MRKQSWESYWKSIEKSFIERQIQLYKAKRGYRKLLQAIPEIGTSGRVLEVGAGKAWLSHMLRVKGWYTIAIDLDPSFVKANSNKVDSYIIGDMYHLSFKENSFDLVMSCGLIEHFDLDTVQKIISEMRRVGKSVVAWFPTCGVEWKVIWSLRNMLGGNIFTQT